MERVNRIWEHPRYQALLCELGDLEKDRRFCRHDTEHFLAAARLAYIYNLEADAGIDREIIYAAALLHDIGRPLEYTKGIPHHEASGQIAKELLPQCGFSEDETAQILEAVLYHREKDRTDTEALGTFLRRADKACRSCFSCSVRKDCKWPREKMNLKVDY